MEQVRLNRWPVLASAAGSKEIGMVFEAHDTATQRHRTAWIAAGPSDGPLMIFVHGWPELSILWRAQMTHFAAEGWRCVAPDMRGYGGSSIPVATRAYRLEEIVRDMTQLHDVLGARPAVWIGHDWGSPVVTALAAHQAQRCRAVVAIALPYFPNGFALDNLVPLVDRSLYPADTYPAGQWDYYLFYQQAFDQAAQDYEANVAGTLAAIFRPGSPNAAGKPSPTASVRANGGRFGAAHRAPDARRDPSMMPQADFDRMVSTFTAHGFRGPDAWYLNDAANIAFCRQAPADGRLAQPVLFINGAWDAICDITRGRLGDPMRAACADLSVVSLEGGHWLMLERPQEVNAAVSSWLKTHHLS